MEDRNSPRVLLIRIELNAVLSAREAFALGFDGEVVGNFFTHALAPGIAEFWEEERVAVEFLAAVAVEAVSPEEVGVAVGSTGGVDIFRNEKSGGAADRRQAGGQLCRPAG